MTQKSQCAIELIKPHETTEWVLLQTVKTQVKGSIMLHFIRVNTICKGKKDLHTK